MSAAGTEVATFNEIERRFLRSRRLLGRLATVSADHMPHVAPVGWSLVDDGTIMIGGRNMAATKKFRDVAREGKAAIVIDEVLPPWRPRGIEVRGRAEAITGDRPHIKIYPERIVSWGALDDVSE